MKDWIIRVIVEWLATFLTEDRVKEWADKARKLFIPWLRSAKDSLIQQLRAYVKDTKSPVDDKAVDALEWFLEAFLPDNEKKL